MSIQEQRKPMTAKRLEQLERLLARIEMEFEEHLDWFDHARNDFMFARPANMDSMMIAIRHYMNQELPRFLSDHPIA